MERKKRTSRFENNKKLRKILVQSGVDTSQLQFSTGFNSINISGYLIKHSGEDLSYEEVDRIYKEFLKVAAYVNSTISNWYISASSIYKVKQNKVKIKTSSEKKEYLD